MTADTLERRVRAILVDAGCSGWVHAARIGGSRAEFDYGADTPVVLASVYKLPLMISLYRLADRNEIDLTATVRVDPARCAEGPTGVSALADPVVMSWRDLAHSMMTVSDNAAADVILARVGIDRVLDDLGELGLRQTRIVGGVAELHARLRAETGTTTVEEAFAALSDPERGTSPTAYDAAYNSAGTARDCTALLAAVWTDRAASPAACALIRDTMRRQVSRSRIASGFPTRTTVVAGKTGTLAAIRNEIAVVEFPGEHPVSVAVFTMSARSTPSLPEVDRAIGTVARLAVTDLRHPSDPASRMR
ncbi:class A beta-lactamase-related serine hydrolase [Tsukamurella sp. 8F]|uniref:serine hydrolase n=1 Tax=unclassified Tsukamurella TaxID=2633480 RepID=UPI0023B9F59C|nr:MULTISPECIES: serine hydrolase [unclassified Tsukamurella]MDF0530212.1 class A beta-lactamase-related serine hydrolase [Tsukamurella sp. 8J]MDF0586529.1 class A beta-lactamase-related serine hydrolase [Tsukamurella sp. 8F]